MSILGAVLRTHPSKLEPVLARLSALPGVDISLNPGDGRLVLVLEDVQDSHGQPISAAAALADMAMWPDVLSTSLVYEYSGPDAPAQGERDMSDYRLWRSRPGASPKNQAQGHVQSIFNTVQFANQVSADTEREQTP